MRFYEFHGRKLVVGNHSFGNVTYSHKKKKDAVRLAKTYRAVSSWYFGVSKPEAVLFIRGPAAIIAGSFARPLGPDLIRRLDRLVLVVSVPFGFVEAAGACRPRTCCCCTRSFLNRYQPLLKIT